MRAHRLGLTLVVLAALAAVGRCSAQNGTAVSLMGC